MNFFFFKVLKPGSKWPSRAFFTVVKMYKDLLEYTNKVFILCYLPPLQVPVRCFNGARLLRCHWPHFNVCSFFKVQHS